jgi:hypothetical protein
MIVNLLGGIGEGSQIQINIHQHRFQLHTLTVIFIFIWCILLIVWISEATVLHYHNNSKLCQIIFLSNVTSNRLLYHHYVHNSDSLKTFHMETTQASCSLQSDCWNAHHFILPSPLLYCSSILHNGYPNQWGFWLTLFTWLVMPCTFV